MIKKLLIAVVLSAGVVPHSFSNIIVSYSSTNTISGSTTYYQYIFSVQIPVGDVLNGDGSTYLTIYDLPQKPYSLSPPSLDWHIGEQLVGLTPSNLAPTDNGSLYNVTLTYEGATKKLLADLQFEFFIYLLTDQWSLDNFVYVWQDYRDQFGGYRLRNGLVVISDGEETENNSYNVPVPATLALFGIGLAGLGWSRRTKV